MGLAMTALSPLIASLLVFGSCAQGIPEFRSTFRYRRTADRGRGLGQGWGLRLNLRWRFEPRPMIPGRREMPIEAFLDAPRRLPCGVPSLCGEEQRQRWQVWVARGGEGMGQ